MSIYSAQSSYSLFSSTKEDQGIDALGNEVTVYVVDDIFNTDMLVRIANTCQKETSTFIQYAQKQWLIRWFSDCAEIKRCGIGTLAAAKYIQDKYSKKNDVKSSSLTLHSAFNQTISDEIISATIEKDSVLGSIIMQAQPLIQIGTPEIFSAEYRHNIASAWSAEDGYIVVELFQAENVKSFCLNTTIKDWLGQKALILTSSSCNHSDIVFRYFAPAFGLDEDKATGSAAVILAPFWQKRLNKDVIKAHQISTEGAFFTYKVNPATIEIIARVEELTQT